MTRNPRRMRLGDATSETALKADRVTGKLGSVILSSYGKATLAAQGRPYNALAPYAASSSLWHAQRACRRHEDTQRICDTLIFLPRIDESPTRFHGPIRVYPAMKPIRLEWGVVCRFH
jgi:hypothetical protein